MNVSCIYSTSIFKSPLFTTTMYNIRVQVEYVRKGGTLFSFGDECWRSNPQNALFCTHINAYKTYWASSQLPPHHVQAVDERKKLYAGPTLLLSLCASNIPFFVVLLYYLFAHFQIFITCYSNLMASTWQVLFSLQLIR